jgi:putative DNA primase/helicase
LRVIGTGDGPSIHKKYPVVDGVSCEIYRKPTGRFITVTGKRYNDAPDTLADLNKFADEVLAELEAVKKEAKAKKEAATKTKPKSDRQLPPLEDIINNGHFELWENDRSRGEYYVVNELIRLGRRDEDIIAIFSDVNNGIAAHCLSKPEKPRDYIMRTIARARAEAGGASADGGPDPDGAEIANLAALSDIGYERQRADAAKRLGVRAAILDRLVQAERDRKRAGAAADKLQGEEIRFEDSEPWDEDVVGTDLLEALTAIVKDHVILELEEAWCIALWIVYTYLADVFRFSPRLGVTSPTRGCGKSTLFDIIRTLVLRGISTANITAAAVFRLVNNYHPCLIIDEADQFLGDKKDLQGLLNSGHKRGDRILRVLGDDQQLRAFDIFGPVAIGQIGVLPNTLIERAIPIQMRRRKKGDREIKLFDDETPEALEPFIALRRKCARWAQDHRIEIGETKVQLPPEAYNRIADNWRILKRIATVAGGEWPERVDKAALKAIKDHTISDEDLLTLLLSDIRSIEFRYTVTERTSSGNGDEMVEVATYDAKGEIPSAVLTEELTRLEGRPWAEMPGKDGREGKKLSQNKLARLLKPVSVIPESIGPTWKRVNGYRLEHFSDAFERYLGEEGVSNLATSHKPVNTGTSEISELRTVKMGCEVGNSKKPNNDGLLRGCEVVKGGSRQGKPDKPANGEDKGLDDNTIGHLASQYREQFYEVRDEDEVDAWLYRALAEYGVFPEFLKAEFARVKDAVFAL